MKPLILYARSIQTGIVKGKTFIRLLRLNLKDEVRSLLKGNVAKLNLVSRDGLIQTTSLMDEPFSGIDVFTSVKKSRRVFTSDLLDERGVLIGKRMKLMILMHIVDKAVP